jgi:hypothetical protein
VNGRTIALTIIGFLIGVLAAGSIGVRVIEEVRAQDDATSLPAENVSSRAPVDSGYFVHADETLVASSAVIPTAVVASGSTLSIDYEVVSLAPAAELPPVEVPTVYPRTWHLTTESGTVDGGPGSPDAGVVVFDLPDGKAAIDVRSVEIVDPLVAYPLDTAFYLSEANPSIAVTGRVRAELLDISDLGDSAIVQIGLYAEDPVDLAFTIEGVGSGWQSTVRQVGAPTIELLWGGGDLPEVLTFRAMGIRWVELEGSYPMSLEAVQ